MEILFFIGLCYAITQAWGASTTAVGNARTNARTRATKRGGHYDAERNKRRAARQATTGWWAREIRHGLPVTREGFRAGWNDHTHILSTTRATSHKTEAGRSGERRRLWAEAQQHWRDVFEAGERRRAREERSPDDAPPLPDGKTPGAPRLVPFTPPGGQGPPQTGQGNGSTNGGNMPTEQAPASADASYEQVVTSSEQVAQAADSLDVSALDQIGPLIDQLGGLISTDGTTLGLGADLARACEEVKTSLAKVKDLAAALHDRVTTTYGPTHEAVAASGEQAAEPAFHNS